MLDFELHGQLMNFEEEHYESIRRAIEEEEKEEKEEEI